MNLDFQRCETQRPSTWPSLATFMVFGPVGFRAARDV